MIFAHILRIIKFIILMDQTLLPEVGLGEKTLNILLQICGLFQFVCILCAVFYKAEVNKKITKTNSVETQNRPGIESNDSVKSVIKAKLRQNKQKHSKRI